MFELNGTSLHLITAALAGADPRGDVCHASAGDVDLWIQAGIEFTDDAGYRAVLPQQPLAGMLLAMVASRAVATGSRHLELEADLNELTMWAQHEPGGGSRAELAVQLRRLGAAQLRFESLDPTTPSGTRRVVTIHLFDELTEEPATVTLSERFFADLAVNVVRE
jgi:hypothetical protein